MNMNDNAKAARGRGTIAARIAGAAIAAGLSLGAIGVLSAAPPANADAACAQRTFTGAFYIKQDDGWRTEFDTTGQSAKGISFTAKSPKGEVLLGRGDAQINGNKMVIAIHWANDWHSRITGTVGDDGIVVGGTKRDWIHNDSGDSGTHYWSSVFPIGCADKTEPVNPPKYNIPTIDLGPTAFVDGENVEVFDAPDGKGNVIGELMENQQVFVQENCQLKSWCQIAGGGLKGFIWGHLRFEQ